MNNLNERAYVLNDSNDRRVLANGIVARRGRHGGREYWEINDNPENDAVCLYGTIESYFTSICLDVWARMSEQNDLLNLDLLLLIHFGVPEQTINAVLYDHKELCMTPWNADILGLN